MKRQCSVSIKQSILADEIKDGKESGVRRELLLKQAFVLQCCMDGRNKRTHRGILGGELIRKNEEIKQSKVAVLDYQLATA